jgi:Tol biopolymer transport system component
MALEPGTRLGPYEVLAPIATDPTGSGRYKASDSRVNRVVSLHVLPPEFSAPELKERLERDARTISSLRHPNICAPVEVGHHDPSTEFLVTEFVDGETLAARLTRGPLPLEEALQLAIALADSLDKAHRQGVVHGGLTPSSILVTSSGPKVLDFGVARFLEDSHLALASSIAVTRTSIPALSRLPAAGLAYMAPEQLAGREPDARSDIFAFGAVLYEMLTGRPPFQEKTTALLVAAIQSVEPDPISRSQPVAPPALDHLVRRCLTKEPTERLQTAWDLLVQLNWIVEGVTSVGLPIPATAARQKRNLAVWAAAAIVSIAAARLVPSALARLRRAPEPFEARFAATGLPTAVTTPISVSPDGRWVIASAGGAIARGVQGLRLDAVTTQLLVKDNNLFQPFWSPDSKWIAFFEDGKLKKAEVSGGPAQIICDAPGPIANGTWNHDGVILYSSGGIIQRVLAAGGQPTAISVLDKSKQEAEHLGPVFLPDGRHYLLVVTSADSGIYVGSLDSPDKTRLFASDTKAVYAEPGYLLFNRGSTVFAQPFDAKKLATSGEPIRVADGVPANATSPISSPGLAKWASFAVSQTGVLVFRTDANAAQNQASGPGEQRAVYWFDRNGGRGPAIGGTGTFTGLDLSPDGKRFAVHVHEGTGGDNWVFDLVEGRLQRLTFDANQDNQSPIWSPDGTRIAFASHRGNRWGVYTKLADGTGAEELITESESIKAPMSWSPDGKLILYNQIGKSGDIWAVPVTGDKKAFPVLESAADETFPQVSPDGKWLAYQSNETGRGEIYIRPFPEGPGKWQVSTDGGAVPRWRRDGKELYFFTVPNLMSSDVRVSGSSLQAGVPQVVFGLPASPNALIGHNFYLPVAIAPDGQRFLLSQPAAVGGLTTGGLADQIAAFVDRGGSPADAAPNSVTVVVNWPRMLKH